MFGLSMKSIIASLLAFSILSHSLVNVGLGLYYNLNKAYIITRLCENKSNPGLHCNGHCYLSKQLKKAEEGESKSTKFFKERNEVFYNNFLQDSFLHIPLLSIRKLNSADSSLYQSGIVGFLLKPPIV